jgi:hypothetical protein
VVSSGNDRRSDVSNASLWAHRVHKIDDTAPAEAISITVGGRDGHRRPEAAWSARRRRRLGAKLVASALNSRRD